MILWFLHAQDSTHDLRNAKQVAKKLILMEKIGLGAAYRRIHANTKIASTCIAIVDELAFLCLTLPFGTAPAPAEYKTVSEASIDLGNDPLQYQYWDTDYLKSPHQSLLPPEGKQKFASHLVKADPLSV